MELLDLARRRAAAAAEALAALERAAEGVSEEARAFLRASLDAARMAAYEMGYLVKALQEGRLGHVDEMLEAVQSHGYDVSRRDEEQRDCPLCGDDAEAVYRLRNGIDTLVIRACANCGLARIDED